MVQKPMPPITCLALEGGGSRCVAYSGMYTVFKRYGLMDGIRHVSGSSGGAIAALLISLGYDAKEGEELLLSMDLEVFLEGYHRWLQSSNWWSVGKTIWSVLNNENHSLVSGNHFQKWLEDCVEKKLGSAQATFADLAKKVEEKKEGNPYKYLYVTGSNISLPFPECRYFSHETEKDMPLATAVRISASYPFIFESIKWKKNIYTDGGLIRNLPVSIFNEKRFIEKGYDFNDKGINPCVLAVKVDSQDEIEQTLWGIKKKVPVTTTGEMATSVYNACGSNVDISEIREARLTLALSDKQINTLQFSVTRNEKLGLIKLAETETENFLENYCYAACDIKTYPDLKSWLNTLTLDDVNRVRQYLEDAINNHEEGNSNDDLEETVSFIKEYIVARLNQLRVASHINEDDRVLNYVYEKRYKLPVNIITHHDKNSWSEKILTAMKRKYKNIQKKLLKADELITRLQFEFEYFPKISNIHCLHDRDHFENIRALALLHDYIKVLNEEKKDLAVKLELNHELPLYSKKESLQYIDFFKKLRSILKSSLQKSNYKQILFIKPFLKLNSDPDGKGFFFFDFHDVLDRKIYVLALRYFFSVYHPRAEHHFAKLYQSYVSEDVTLPKDYKKLSKILNLKGEQLFIHALRLEELIHYLQSQFQNQNRSLISLDQLFALKKKNNIHDNDEIPMGHLIFSHSIFKKKAKSSLCHPRAGGDTFKIDPHSPSP